MPDAKVYNSANHRLQPPLYHDAAFIRKLNEMALAGALPAGRGGIVSRKSPPLTTIADSDKALKAILHALILDAQASAFREKWQKTRNRRPIKRWYEDVPSPNNAHRIGPLWRSATPLLKLEMAHLALKTVPSCGFTLHIGQDVAAEMIEGDRPAKRVICDLLSRHLKNALGRRVDYWIAYEVGVGAQPLHLHGELTCPPDEPEKVLAALREAGGKWGGNNTFRHARQADLCEMATDGGWVTYATEKLRASDDLDLIKEGTFITEGLKREAAALYDAVRDHVRLDAPAVKSKPKATHGPRATKPETGAGTDPSQSAAATKGRDQVAPADDFDMDTLDDETLQMIYDSLHYDDSPL